MTDPCWPDAPDEPEGPVEPLYGPPELTVYPSEVEPAPALYGPTGDVIRWRAPWPVGFRSAKEMP